MLHRLIAVLLIGASVGAQTRPEISDQYAETAQKLIAAALADPNNTARLEYLCDRIGNRLSGSPSLERAVEWSAEEMRKAGLENVQPPPVMVPHWVRGAESAVMIAPVYKQLVMIGLGMSVGTPRQGVTGAVIAVRNVDDLASLGREGITGKIVLFTPQANSPTVERGPSVAGSMGALAVLVHTPHTRGISYDEDGPKIPAAAISVEDALMMNRLISAGTPVQVRLMMDDRLEPDTQSHNVIGDLRGNEKPQEIVVLGAHIDTWDIGQGAQDDGSGMMAALEAVLLIKQLGLHPRRTIRVLFFVNEENGGAGDRAYGAMIGDDVRNHVAAIVDDRDAERPTGFGFGARDQDKQAPRAFGIAAEIGKLLDGIGAGAMKAGGGGGHIPSLTSHGVPGFGINTVNVNYEQTNHTNADSFDKIVKRDFQLHVAALAVLSDVLADMPERLSDLN
jgi:hypothetical protein